jgi:hypothetical protein
MGTGTKGTGQIGNELYTLREQFFLLLTVIKPFDEVFLGTAIINH